MNKPLLCTAALLESTASLMGQCPPDGESEMGGDPLSDKAAAEAFTRRHCHEPSFRSPLADRLHASGKHWCWASGAYHRSGTPRCSVPARTQLADGTWWCHVHEPAGVEKREAAARAARDADHARLRARIDADQERRRRAEAFPRLLETLRQIERGHNDPRALAREVLKDWPEEQRSDDAA